MIQLFHEGTFIVLIYAQFESFLLPQVHVTVLNDPVVENRIHVPSFIQDMRRRPRIIGNESKVTALSLSSLFSFHTQLGVSPYLTAFIFFMVKDMRCEVSFGASRPRPPQSSIIEYVGSHGDALADRRESQRRLFGSCLLARYHAWDPGDLIGPLQEVSDGVLTTTELCITPIVVHKIREFNGN